MIKQSPRNSFAIRHSRLQAGSATKGSLGYIFVRMRSVISKPQRWGRHMSTLLASFFLPKKPGQSILFTSNMPSSQENREFKKWLRQRQRQRHKSMIWLVEWGKIIVLHVRHAFWCNVLTKSTKRRREIFIFEVLTTTRARSGKSFILCLYMITIRAKQARVHSAYFVQRDQNGIIAKDLT